MCLINTQFCGKNTLKEKLKMKFRSIAAFLMLSVAFAESEEHDVEGMAGRPKQPTESTEDGVPPLPSSKRLGIHSGYFWGYSQGALLSISDDYTNVCSLAFRRLHEAFEPENFLGRFILANSVKYVAMPIALLTDAARHNWAVATRVGAVGFKPEFWDFSEEGNIRHGSNPVGLWVAPLRTWFKDSLSRAVSNIKQGPIVRYDDQTFEVSESEKYFDAQKLERLKDLSKRYFQFSGKDEEKLTKEEKKELFETDPWTADWGITVYAAGFNSHQDYARLIQDKSYFKEANYLDSVNYIRARLYLPLFSLLDLTDSYVGDVRKVKERYKLKNYDISAAKICFASLSGVLLSSSFYNAIKHANWTYYSSGPAEYNAYEWRGVKVPDVLTYVNNIGLSYHISSGYKFTDTLFFPVSVELNVFGETAAEATVGVLKKFPSLLNLDVQADVRWGRGGIDGNLKASITPYGSMFLEAGLNVYHPQNLEGRRQIMSFEQGKRHAEFYVKLGALF